MGYTHYFTFKKAPKGQAAKVEKLYQLAIKDCQKIIRKYSKEFGGLSGYSAHSTKYSGINFNGSERMGSCEDFVLREHYNENDLNNFCKTGQYDYDKVVVACLIALKNRLGELISIGSDGFEHEWSAGLLMARVYLRKQKLFKPIGLRRMERAS